jgi:hypothetical protein
LSWRGLLLERTERQKQDEPEFPPKEIQRKSKGNSGEPKDAHKANAGIARQAAVSNNRVNEV